MPWDVLVFLLFFLNGLDSDWNVPYGFSISRILFSYHTICINSSVFGLPVVYKNFEIPVAAFCNGKHEGH